MRNRLNMLWLHIPKLREMWRTRGVVCILITRRRNLSPLQVESAATVSICCYLVFQWSCGRKELVRRSSLVAVKVVLMPGDGKGNNRISPVTLYGVFLKNKVNKTWDAELRILIICLHLWGRRGDAVRGARERERERHGQGHEEREWVREERGVLWNTQTSVTWRCWRGKHAAAFRCDRGRGRKEAGWYKPEQWRESSKHSLLKIIQQQCITVSQPAVCIYEMFFSK